MLLFRHNFVSCCPSNLLSGSPPPPLCIQTVCDWAGVGRVESCSRPYSAGVYHPVSNQIQNLQNCKTIPKQNPSWGGGSQTDKHLPQSPFLDEDILHCFLSVYAFYGCRITCVKMFTLLAARLNKFSIKCAAFYVSMIVEMVL
jgi:hypothetical protein